MLVFYGVLFYGVLLTFYVMFVAGFFLLLFWLCPFLKNQMVWLGFVFRLFGVLHFLF